MFFRFPNHKKRPEPVTRQQKIRELELLEKEQHRLFIIGHSVPRHMQEKMQKLAGEIRG